MARWLWLAVVPGGSFIAAALVIRWFLRRSKTEPTRLELMRGLIEQEETS